MYPLGPFLLAWSHTYNCNTVLHQLFFTCERMHIYSQFWLFVAMYVFQLIPTSITFLNQYNNYCYIYIDHNVFVYVIRMSVIDCMHAYMYRGFYIFEGAQLSTWSFKVTKINAYVWHHEWDYMQVLSGGWVAA